MKPRSSSLEPSGCSSGSFPDLRVSLAAFRSHSLTDEEGDLSGLNNQETRSQQHKLTTFEQVGHKVLLYRVPQCMSPRRNWDSPNPSSASECAPPPPPNLRVGGHTRLRMRGWGSPYSDDVRKGLALCLLCEVVFLLLIKDRRFPVGMGINYCITLEGFGLATRPRPPPQLVFFFALTCKS